MKYIYCSILSLFLTTSGFSDEPEKLVRLRTGYDGAVERAVAPIRKTYITELLKLKAEYTKSSKLQEAPAVEAEIAKIAPPSPKGGSPSEDTADSTTIKRLNQFATPQALSEWLIGTVWTASDGDYIRFPDTAHFQEWKQDLQSDSKPYNYASEEVGKLKFNWLGNGKAGVLQISKDLKKMENGYKTFVRSKSK